MKNTIDNIRLSTHFMLSEFLNLKKYPDNVPDTQQLVEFLKRHPQTDQLLTGNGWLHISWNPIATPRHDVRVGYYK